MERFHFYGVEKSQTCIEDYTCMLSLKLEICMCISARLRNVLITHYSSLSHLYGISIHPLGRSSKWMRFRRKICNQYDHHAYISSRMHHSSAVSNMLGHIMTGPAALMTVLLCKMAGSLGESSRGVYLMINQGFRPGILFLRRCLVTHHLQAPPSR